MKAKRLEVLKKLKKGEINIEQAEKELLVSGSTCENISSQAVKSDWDSPPMGGFSDW